MPCLLPQLLWYWPELHCSRSTFAGSMCRARRTGPATESDPVSSIVKCNSSKYKWILRRRLVDDRRKYSARGDTEQHPNDGPARKQDEHTAERGREDLLRLRAERDTNAEFAQPLADGVRGETEGAGDREQQGKSAKQAEGDRCHLGHKERHSKLVAPRTRFPYGYGRVKIVDHFADGGRHLVRGLDRAIGPQPHEE